MLAKVQSAGLVGVEAFGVCAEVEVAGGLPAYHLVGLGASAVKEGGVRVRAALEHSGWKVPARRITVNLAPADVRKDGAAFDLPIAIGILAALEIIPCSALDDVLLLGELSLDGTLRRVAGGLPVAMLARARRTRALILPRASASEAAMLPDVPVLAADSLAEVANYLIGGAPLAAADGVVPAAPDSGLDLTDVRGQEECKLALEIAAAGGHNLLLIGEPGAGKSMLARRLPTILPPLDDSEAIETTAIYSAAGKLNGISIIRQPPFRAPHHESSPASIVGGGTIPKPGEISLAHNGVLFLDELPEFRRASLEALRQPLEDRSVTVTRARAVVRFPAAFALVGAMNPCPCGYFASRARSCACDSGAIRKYRGRVSGPLVDRIDLHVQVPAVAFADLSSDREGESSEVVRGRVLYARERQRRRLAGTRMRSNAQLGPREITRYCRLDGDSSSMLGEVARRRGLSARGIHRTLRVARTLADLNGRDDIVRGDVQTALAFRVLDQEVL